jgi:hypothetical protein
MTTKSSSGSFENNKCVPKEKEATCLKITLIASITTLLLNLTTIIGFISGLLYNPIYVFFIITTIFAALFMILFILAIKSQSTVQFYYVILFILIALMYLITILIIFFPDEPNTIYLPNPTSIIDL